MQIRRFCSGGGKGGGPNVVKEVLYVLGTWIVVKSWINGRSKGGPNPQNPQFYCPKIIVH